VGCDLALYEDCLCFFDKNVESTTAYAEGRVDGLISLYDDEHGVPHGMVPQVVQYLEDAGHTTEISNSDRVDINLDDLTVDYMTVPVGDKRVPVYDHIYDATRAVLEAGGGIVKSPTSCHAYGERVMRACGRIAYVEDVQLGDLLMGPDGTPRRVLVRHEGVADLYKVTPQRGDPFTVTGTHPLTLVRTPCKKRLRVFKNCLDNSVLDVPVVDYIKWSKTQKHIHKLFKVPVDTFHRPQSTQPIPAYMMGVLLGDGSLGSGTPMVTTMDDEISQAVYALANDLGMKVNRREDSRGNRASYFSIVNPTRNARVPNKLKKKLLDAGIPSFTCSHKYIPEQYKYATRANRLAVLAGLIDTDGSANIRDRCSTYEFSSVSKQLADDVVFVARSVGFYAASTAKYVHGRKYYRVYISGAIWDIPVRIPRKRITPYVRRTDVLRSAFTVTPVGAGAFVGFTVDKDHRYLLPDFTVTHNSGKTSMIGLLCLKVYCEWQQPILVVVPKKGLVTQTVNALSSYYEQGEPTVGSIAGGVFIPGDIVVATSASLDVAFKNKMKKKYRPIVNLVQNACMLINDEVHHLSANTYYKLTLQRAKSARLRIGMSGTPLRYDTLQDAKLIAACGDIVYEVKDAELKRLGLVANERIQMLLYEPPVKALPKENKISLLRAHYAAKMVSKKQGVSAYQDAYATYVVKCPHYNDCIARIAQYMVEEQGRPTLIIARRHDHLDNIARYLRRYELDFRRVDGKVPMAERTQSKQDFEDKVVPIILASTVFDEGESVDAIEAVILADGVRRVQSTIQRIGRGRRLEAGGKDDVLVVDMVPTGSPMLIDQAADRAEHYEREEYSVAITTVKCDDPLEFNAW